MTAPGAVPVEALARLTTVARSPGVTTAVRVDDLRAVLRLLGQISEERYVLTAMLLRS